MLVHAFPVMLAFVEHNYHRPIQNSWPMIMMIYPFIIRSSLLGYPSPPTDSIRAIMIGWRLRGKIIRTVPCCVVYDSCAQYV